MIRIFTLLFILLAAPRAHCVEDVLFYPQKAWEVGLTMGKFLPKGVSSGVKEMLTFTGIHASFPTKLTHFEFMYISGRGGDVDYMNASIGMRIDFEAYDVVNGFMTLGMDYHRYKRAPTQVFTFDYTAKSGIHGGFGFTSQISGPLFIRSDIKLNIGPGKSLYIGVGLTYHFWDDSDENTTSN